MKLTRLAIGLASALACTGCDAVAHLDWFYDAASFEASSGGSSRHAPRPTAHAARATASPARQAQPAPARLSVVTANLKRCREPRSLVALAQHLSAGGAAPDFILCQEVIFGRSQRHGDTAEALAGALGCCSRGSRRGNDGEGVAIVSRYPFRHYETRALAARTSSLLLGFRRVSVMGEFDVPRIGLVRVVSVHLAHWPFEEHVRWEQMRETLAWIARRDRAVPADVIILGGDFNAGPGSSTLSLVRAWGEAGGIAFEDHNTTEPTMALRRVDHVFIAAADRRVRLEGERVLGMGAVPASDGGTRRVSDHDAVAHRYVVAKKGTELPLETRSHRRGGGPD